MSLRNVWDLLLPSGVTEGDGMNGGGSLRMPFVDVEVDRLGFVSEEPLEGSIRGTVTQSGSSDTANGFDGRFGFGMEPFCGGFTVDRAGWLLSSHHFLLSELAGGSPGSMES